MFFIWTEGFLCGRFLPSAAKRQKNAGVVLTKSITRWTSGWYWLDPEHTELTLSLTHSRFIVNLLIVATSLFCHWNDEGELSPNGSISWYFRLATYEDSITWFMAMLPCCHEVECFHRKLAISPCCFISRAEKCQMEPTMEPTIPTIHQRLTYRYSIIPMISWFINPLWFPCTIYNHIYTYEIPFNPQ